MPSAGGQCGAGDTYILRPPIKRRGSARPRATARDLHIVFDCSPLVHRVRGKCGYFVLASFATRFHVQLARDLHIVSHPRPRVRALRSVRRLLDNRTVTPRAVRHAKGRLAEI